MPSAAAISPISRAPEPIGTLPADSMAAKIRKACIRATCPTFWSGPTDAAGCNEDQGRDRRSTPMLDADGAALVIHAAPDDYRTDPSGNSGARIACGVFNSG